MAARGRENESLVTGSDDSLSQTGNEKRAAGKWVSRFGRARWKAVGISIPDGGGGGHGGRGDNSPGFSAHSVYESP